MSTVDSLSMYNPYMMSNPYMMNDPYLMAALAQQTPTVSSPSFKGTSSTAATTAATTDTTAATQPALVQQLPATEEKKSGVAGKILALGAMVAIGLVTHKASKIGPQVEKNYFKRAWKGAQGWVKGVGEKVTPKNPTIFKSNGKNVVTIPGRTNVITGSEEEMEKALKAIGEKMPETDLSKLLVKEGGSKFREGSGISGIKFTETAGKNNNKYRVIWVKNNVIVYDLKTNRKFTWSELKQECPNIANTIEKRLNLIKNGQQNLQDASIESFKVQTINPDTGLISTIRYRNKLNGEGHVVTESKLLNCHSDKFDLESTAVYALKDNPEVKKQIENFVSGETKDLIHINTTVPKVELKSEKGQITADLILDKNGKLIGIRKLGEKDIIKPDSEVFRALKARNEETIKNKTKSENLEDKFKKYKLAA